MPSLKERFPEKSPSLRDRFPAKDIATSDDMGVFETFTTGLGEGVKTNAIGMIGRKMRLGTSTKDEMKWAQDNSMAMGETEGFSRPAGRIVGQLLDQMRRAIPEATKGGLALGTVAAVAGQLGPQVLTPEEVVTVPSAFIAGASIMGQTEMISLAFDIESGSAYMELKELQERGIIEVDDNFIGQMADAVGTINAGMEGGAFAVFAAPFKRVAKRAILSEARKILTNPTKKAAVLAGMKAGGANYLAEVLTESLQEVTNIAGETVSGKPLVVDEALGRVGSIASEVARGAWLPSLPGSVINIRADAQISKMKSTLKKRGATDEQVTAVTNGSVSVVEMEAMLIEDSVKRDAALTEATKMLDTGEPLTIEQSNAIIEIHDEMVEGKDIKATEEVLTVEQKLDQINEIRLAEEIKQAKKKELTVMQKVGKIKNALMRKAVKPTIRSGRKQAKFDYETNKEIQELSRISGLTQEEASIEYSNLAPPTNEVERVNTRLLGMKAFGNEATPEMINQVYEDVMRIKKAGKEAKNKQEFQRKLERAEMVQKLTEKGESIKGDKKTISTKIGNAYRRGVADMRSNIASMFGTEIADHYDLSQVEQDRRVAVQQKRREIDDAIIEIYGDKSVAKTIKRLVRDDGYTITGKNSGLLELNKMQLIDIYNSLKNEHSKKSYIKEFNQDEKFDIVKFVNSTLTDSDKKFAEYLQEQVQSYREVLNKKNIEDTGVDLGIIENYWPRKSETQEDLLTYFRMQSNVPSAQKLRETQGHVIPVPRDAYLTTIRHIEQAEWINKVSRKYDENIRDFKNAKTKNLITRKYGEGVYNGLMDSIDRNSLSSNNKQVDFGFNIFNFLINNWVVANVAFNPTVIARQMGSVTNYAQHMNPGKWAVNFNKGLLTPKKTFNYMWKNSEYLRERWQIGNSDATERALRDARKLSSWWGSFNNVLTSGSRATDIGAQIYGGYPLIKEFKKTMSTEEAFKKFEKISRREQQSGLQANLSNVQSNPYARWLFAFKNTPMQYARLQADAIYRYQNGEISKAQLGKILGLVGVIQPIMYSMMGGLVVAAMKAAGGEDEDKLIEELGLSTASNIMSAPFNFIPILGDAVKAASRKTLGQKTYKPFGVPVYDDLNIVWDKFGKNEKTMEDWFVITSMLQEPVFPLPTGTAKRYYDYFADDKKTTVF